MRISKRFALAALVFIGLAGLAPLQARPAEAELLQSGLEQDGTYLLGLRIKLQPGWMTYWRRPGEAGIAPHFRTDESRNLKTAEILFSFPKIFQEGDYTTLGYDGEVVLPLRVAAQDSSRPVLLRLKMEYGVCEKICLRESREFEITLLPHIVLENRLAIMQAMQKIPERNDNVISDPALSKQGDKLEFLLKREEAYEFAMLEFSDAVYIARPSGASNGKISFMLSQPPPADTVMRVTVVGKSKAFEAHKTL